MDIGGSCSVLGVRWPSTRRRENFAAMLDGLDVTAPAAGISGSQGAET